MNFFLSRVIILFFILFSPLINASPSWQGCGCHLSHTTGICPTKLTFLAGSTTFFTCKSLFKEKPWACYALGGGVILAGAFMKSFWEYYTEEDALFDLPLSQSPKTQKKNLFCPYNILEYLLHGPHYSGCFHTLPPLSRTPPLENPEEELERASK